MISEHIVYASIIYDFQYSDPNNLSESNKLAHICR